MDLEIIDNPDVADQSLTNTCEICLKINFWEELFMVFPLGCHVNLESMRLSFIITNLIEVHRRIIVVNIRKQINVATTEMLFERVDDVRTDGHLVIIISR